MLDGVAAELDVGSACADVEAGVGHLHGCLLVLDGLLQQLDVLLHVEDLLQENVKECIEDFRAANISVWMLTGDKGLTAKEIGVSCGLIPPE